VSAQLQKVDLQIPEHETFRLISAHKNFMMLDPCNGYVRRVTYDEIADAIG